MTFVAPLRALDFLPDSYLMYIRSNRCLKCAAFEQWSEFHLVSINVETGTRRVVPVASKDRDLPVGLTHLPVKTIPFCHRCITCVNRVHEGPSASERWAETLRRKYPTATPKPMYVAEPAVTSRPPVPTPRHRTTCTDIDQL